jgi:hypothetical protein
MRFLAVLFLCLVPLTHVEAKPSPYLGDTFSGDRYVAHSPEAQKRPVVRQRYSSKVRYLYRVKRAPRAAPKRYQAPLTLAEGLGREISRARPRAWCGWWLSRHLGMNNRNLWLARNWASVGRNAGGPQVGAVVVWRHHVGIITGRTGNKWVVKSGNDGHRVRERPRSIAGAIAFRFAS